MNRFIIRCINTIIDVYTHRTTDTAKGKRDRTTESDTIRSRYSRSLERQETYRGTIVQCMRRILQERNEKNATSKLAESKRGKKEPFTSTSLTLSLSLFFYSIIYNPQIWVFLFIIDTSFGDELMAYNYYNLSVIMHTTHCLLSRECIG